MSCRKRKKSEMDRRGFLKRFGALVGVATVAPTVVHTVVKAAADPTYPEVWPQWRIDEIRALRGAQVGTLGGVRAYETDYGRSMRLSEFEKRVKPFYSWKRCRPGKQWIVDDPVTSEQMAQNADWYDRVWEAYTRTMGSRPTVYETMRLEGEIPAFAEARRSVAGIRAEDALKAVAEDYLTGQTHFWRI